MATENFARYSQSQGTLDFIPVIDGFEGPSERLGSGWAGRGEGKNNPVMQHVKSTGPLPQGWYDIQAPATASTGEYSLRLIPDPENQMFGRDRFLAHGPAKDVVLRGQESKGCIILVRSCREALWESGVRRLQVVA